ncbi:MAG: YIP1 family protein [Chloroflexi bacterium]|nr:YIP1 family protein [Chloroflexota bacterium]
MTTTPDPEPQSTRRLQWSWIPLALFRPGKGMRRVAAQNRGVWLTPLLTLTLAALARVLAAGWVKQTAALSGEIPLPPDFQYYTPDMQAQYMQAMQATQGPVFNYVFPAILALLTAWLGWLLLGGLVHLVLTMLGGRGDTSVSMNIAAWAGLPFAVRDLVRAVAILISRQTIDNPGLAGFAPAEAAGFMAYLVAWLPFIDIYLLWHILLLAVGARAATSLPRLKATLGVLLPLLLVIALGALISFGAARLGDMTVTRPFF